MSWIKDANKLGRYIHTRNGFRVYMVKDSQCIETFEEIDGVKWRRTDFINSVRIAINKDGVTFSGDLHGIAWKLQKYAIEKFYGAEFKPVNSENPDLHK